MGTTRTYMTIRIVRTSVYVELQLLAILVILRR